MSDELLAEVNHAHDLRSRAQSSKDPLDSILWLHSRSSVQAHIRSEKRLDVLQRLHLSNDNAKRTWEVLSELRGKPSNSHSLPVHLNVDGIDVEDPLDIANYLNRYFATIGSASQSAPYYSTTALPAENSCTPFPLLVLPPSTPDDIRLISALKVNTLDNLKDG
eukprot:Pompholyxophrys_punicea_v1_NODE_715_length_1405_cov_21.145185.p1 type:complete len:164 gc:universal NODE_715_length_1405_cov_21.145185:971-480(-)